MEIALCCKMKDDEMNHKPEGCMHIMWVPGMTTSEDAQQTRHPEAGDSKHTNPFGILETRCQNFQHLQRHQSHTCCSAKALQGTGP